MPGAAAADAAPEASAEIHIGLPSGSAERIDVLPRLDRVVLELPGDAKVPADFRLASGGLIEDAGVATTADGRMRLELALGAGVLDRVSFEPQGLGLYFSSRLAAALDPGDPQQRYLLGPDDKVLLTVHNHPEATGPLTVTREGSITAPWVGEVQAAGLTPRQLAAKTADLLGRQYLVDPQVDITVLEFRSQWVMVGGMVRQAGRIPLRGGTRLKEVLGEAGGFDESNGAGEEIVISRRVGGSREAVTFRVDRRDFESGRDNPVLAPGDIIEVSRAKFCYIQGEVRRSDAIPVDREMTLLRVITLAGGLTEWADRKNVRVIRKGSGSPAERVYNLKRIMEGKDTDPALEGGELIIVGRRFL